MGIQFDKALGIHGDALKLRAERTRILASNLANESTPGYQARDFDFASELAKGKPLNKMDALLIDTDGVDAKFRTPNHPTQDGNTVELGVEQAEFSQNSTDFQTGLAFLNIKLKGLAKAIAG